MQVYPRTIAANESVVWAELDGESVLLNVVTGIYFGLDAVGTSIWRQLSQSANEDEIVEALLAEFEVDPVVLRSDLTNFLNLLMAKGLMRFVDA